MVLREGLEPSRLYSQRILSPVCLPIPPPKRVAARGVCARTVSRARGVSHLALSANSNVKERCCYYYIPLHVCLHDLRQSAPAGSHKMLCLARVAVRGRKLSCAQGAGVMIKCPFRSNHQFTGNQPAGRDKEEEYQGVDRAASSSTIITIKSPIYHVNSYEAQTRATSVNPDR